MLNLPAVPPTGIELRKDIDIVALIEIKRGRILRMEGVDRSDSANYSRQHGHEEIA